ncbi:chromosome segregation protein SMC [Gephyromycinifex aptenodytis]|uniref:chromosome segregation protein SMC n=1 Tax=Gephyromycinifex aptenodytis TaxID=2716227 RepID=UPI0014462F48|nr:chromosome segregation protein SMC [Gephyromycinifex aptenodytis]
MYVKSLTLRGFKSFASATHLRLEPGITCIVGPNGSGKSNVVDALAWVMGEQGAKSLRGGKMEDVIFAGTSGRPPLGRAEVAMTIDNSDGALPIDYAEVTISRTMFRTGGSEYAINGTHCRLLDIQELLSDSGIGREMHVIVGQGQLDAVLRATPEERRGFIEEAAGVLKHRKRKERALRKLETMETNLRRVQDLTTEIRRQLGPLGRQAETARRAAVIQADVRDSRLRLLADDLVQLTSAYQAEVADEAAHVQRREEAEANLQRAADELSRLQRAAETAATEHTQAQERWYALSSLRERLAATGSLAAERARLLGQSEAETTDHGRDPEVLAAQAEQAREQEAELRAQIEQARAALENIVAERAQAEKAHAAEQDRLARLIRAAADRREGIARLQGQVGAKRSRIEAGEAELGRLADSAERARASSAEAEREFATLEAGVADDEEGEEGLDVAYEEAEAALGQTEAEIAALEEEERGAESERSSFAARREALALGLRRADGAEVLLNSGGENVLGAVSSLLDVVPGREAAVAAALGYAADGVAVTSLEAAREALGQLRRDDAGGTTLLVGAAQLPEISGEPISLGDDAIWAAEAVTAPSELSATVAHLLAGVALVPDEAAALALVTSAGVVAVTADGDVYAPGFVRGGGSSAPSLLEVEAAVEEASAAENAAAHRRDQARFALANARARAEQQQVRVEAALADLHASDARLAGIAEQLGRLSAQIRSARAEVERTEKSAAAVREGLGKDRAELEALERRLADAHALKSEDEDHEPSTAERDRLAAAAAAARAGETEGRLALRSREERLRATAGRAEGLEKSARAERAARQAAAQRRQRRARQVAVAREVEAAAELAGELVAAAVEVAAVRRAETSQARAEIERELTGVRQRSQELTTLVRDLTDSVHRDEIARAEQRLRIEALRTRAIEELGTEPDSLVEEFGPHQPIPVIPEPDADPNAEPPPARPFVREEQEKRLRKAERKLAQLGRINPLALEEFSALEERHSFLVEQTEDLKKSRADLLDIVDEVDARVQQAFAEAFADTAEQFEGVFSRLFPGGEGRLVLTNPSDMLTTGIEVEARPPGKKIKRLSLLSGGERSLTAVALLVAIFKARPSPFYIMDEVEAALDDTNLGRLLTIFEELRDSSQLIVITHQKRTMEVADALYGVTMRGDGVTTVVSQRIRQSQPA